MVNRIQYIIWGVLRAPASKKAEETIRADYITDKHEQAYLPSLAVNTNRVENEGEDWNIFIWPDMKPSSPFNSSGLCQLLKF